MLKTYAVAPSREEPLHERMILHGQFDERLVHQIDIASSPHSKMQERDQQVANAPGLDASFETHWIMEWNMRAEFLVGEFDKLRVIVGNVREVGTFKNEVNAIDLRTHKD